MNPHTAHSERMRYKCCECGSDRSVIKGTLLGYQSAFSSFSWLPLEGIFMKVTTRTLNACATNATSVVAIGQ
jgi:transposase-like protein